MKVPKETEVLHWVVDRKEFCVIFDFYPYLWASYLVCKNLARFASILSNKQWTENPRLPFSPNSHATHHQISTSSSSSSSPPSPPSGPSAPSSTPRFFSPFLPLPRTQLPSQPTVPSSPTPFPPPIASTRSDWSPRAEPACFHPEFHRTTSETRDSPLYIPRPLLLYS